MASHVVTARAGILLTACSLLKETKKPTKKKKIILDLRFLTSSTMTSENCTQAHMQQNRILYLCISLFENVSESGCMYMYICNISNTNELKPVKERINKHKVKTLKIVLNGI